MKIQFLKQPIIAVDEINVSVILANKYNVKVHELEPKKMGIWLRRVDKT